jgi:hypothetical protein
MFFGTKIKTENLKNSSEININNVDQIIESLEAKFESKTLTITYDDLRQQVRELAYKKSEDAGHPWGKDKEFWIEAEKELFGEQPLVNGCYCLKNKLGKDILICPINSEKPVEIEF